VLTRGRLTFNHATTQKENFSSIEVNLRHVWGANNSPLSANFHSLNSNVPALDDITLSKTELEWRATLRGIKLLVVVLVSANVVNSNLVEIRISMVLLTLQKSSTYLLASSNGWSIADNHIFNDNAAVKGLLSWSTLGFHICGKEIKLGLDFKSKICVVQTTIRY
jgi:hypothetical protein